MINLVEVNPQSKDHLSILFELLKGRDYSISHKNMISFEDHIHFARNNPYRKWFIIYKFNRVIGTCYCTYENLLGINLNVHKVDLYKEIIIELTSCLSPLAPKPSVRNKNFSINIPPNNKILQKALLDLDAIPIQVTYLLS